MKPSAVRRPATTDQRRTPLVHRSKVRKAPLWTALRCCDQPRLHLTPLSTDTTAERPTSRRFRPFCGAAASHDRPKRMPLVHRPTVRKAPLWTALRCGGQPPPKRASLSTAERSTRRRFEALCGAEPRQVKAVLCATQAPTANAYAWGPAPAVAHELLPTQAAAVCREDGQGLLPVEVAAMSGRWRGGSERGADGRWLRFAAAGCGIDWLWRRSVVGLIGCWTNRLWIVEPTVGLMCTSIGCRTDGFLPGLVVAPSAF